MRTAGNLWKNLKAAEHWRGDSIRNGVVAAGRSKSGARTRAHPKALRAKFRGLLSFRVSFGSAGRPRTAFGRGLRSEMGS